LLIVSVREFEIHSGIKLRPRSYEQCNNDSTYKETQMKNILNRTLALAIMASSIAGSAAAETKPCSDQQNSTQSSASKADKHSKKAKQTKQTKPKQEQPDNSFYAIFG